MNECKVAFAPAYQKCCVSTQELYTEVDLDTIPDIVNRHLLKFNKVVADTIASWCNNKLQPDFSKKIHFIMSPMAVGDLETFEGIVEDWGKWSIISGNRNNIDLVPAGTLSNEYELSLQYLVNTGRFCSDCHAFTECTGDRWVCTSCNRYVLCHKGTDCAMGSVADADVRALRVRAHREFDKLWREQLISRDRCYRELVHVLGVNDEYAHIGVLNSKEQLDRTISWAKGRYETLKKKG